MSLNCILISALTINYKFFHLWPLIWRLFWHYMDFLLWFRIIIDFSCLMIPWWLLHPTPHKEEVIYKSTGRKNSQANFCADHSCSSETQSDTMIDETQLFAFVAMAVWETEMLRVNDSNNWPFAKPEGVLLMMCKVKAQVQRQPPLEVTCWGLSQTSEEAAPMKVV